MCIFAKKGPAVTLLLLQTLEELSLAEGHLGSHISMLLNSLGAVYHLRTLDISANDLGNFGARILAKVRF